MVVAGEFRGPVVLISPSFSRKDESKFPRVLDRLGVYRAPPFALMMKLVGPAMKNSLPPSRRDASLIAAIFKNNDPRFLWRQTRVYLGYLDRHGSLAGRLCDAVVPTWVAFGSDDDVGLTEDERRVLDACPHMTLTTIADTGHFALNDKPKRVAELVLAAVSSVG